MKVPDVRHDIMPFSLTFTSFSFRQFIILGYISGYYYYDNGELCKNSQLFLYLLWERKPYIFCRCSEIVTLFCFLECILDFFEYVRVERTSSNVITPLRCNWTGNVVRMRPWFSVRSTILVTCEYFGEAYYCNKFGRNSGFITDFETIYLTLTLKYSIDEAILYTTAWNCFTWRPPAGLLDIARSARIVPSRHVGFAFIVFMYSTTRSVRI